MLINNQPTNRVSLTIASLRFKGTCTSTRNPRQHAHNTTAFRPYHTLCQQISHLCALSPLWNSHHTFVHACHNFIPPFRIHAALSYHRTIGKVSGNRLEIVTAVLSHFATYTVQTHQAGKISLSPQKQVRPKEQTEIQSVPEGEANKS